MEKTTAELDATLVLNYVEEDEVEMLEIEVLDPPILDSSFDENQNSTHDSKQRSVEDTPEKEKGLVVRIANRDLSPRKIVAEAEEDTAVGQDAEIINVSEKTAVPQSLKLGLKPKKTASTSIRAKRGRTIEKIKDPEAPLAKKVKTAVIATNKTSNSDRTSQPLDPKLQEGTTKALEEKNCNSTLPEHNSQPPMSNGTGQGNLKSKKVVKSRIIKKLEITKPRRGRSITTAVKEALVADVTKAIKPPKVQKTQKTALDNNIDAVQVPTSEINDRVNDPEPPKKKRGRPKGYSPKKALLSKVTKELESSKILENNSTTTTITKSIEIEATQQNPILNNNLKTFEAEVLSSKTGTEAKVFEIFKTKKGRPKSSETKTVETEPIGKNSKPLVSKNSRSKSLETKTQKSVDLKQISVDEKDKAGVTSSKIGSETQVFEIFKAKKGRPKTSETKTVATEPVSKNSKAIVSKNSRSKSLETKTKKSVDLKQISVVEKDAVPTQLNSSTSVKTNQVEDLESSQTKALPSPSMTTKEELLNHNGTSLKVGQKTRKGKKSLATKTDLLPSTSKLSSTAVEVESITGKDKNSEMSKIDSHPSEPMILSSENSTVLKVGLKTNKAKDSEASKTKSSTSKVTKQKVNKHNGTSVKVRPKSKKENAKVNKKESTSKVTTTTLNNKSSTTVELEPITIIDTDLEASKLDPIPTTSKETKEKVNKHNSTTVKVGPKTKKDNNAKVSKKESTSNTTTTKLQNDTSTTVDLEPTTIIDKDLEASKMDPIPSTSKVTKEKVNKHSSTSVKVGPKSKKDNNAKVSKTESISKATTTKLHNESSTTVDLETATIKDKDLETNKMESIPSTSKVTKEKLNNQNSTTVKGGPKTKKDNNTKVSKKESTSKVTATKVHNESSTTVDLEPTTIIDTNLEASKMDSIPSTSKVMKENHNNQNSTTVKGGPKTNKAKGSEASQTESLPSTSKVIKGKLNKHSSTSVKVAPKTKKDNNVEASKSESALSTSEITKEPLPKRNSISIMGPKTKKQKVLDASNTEADSVIETIDLELLDSNESKLVGSEKPVGTTKAKRVEKESIVSKIVASKPSTSKVSETDSLKTNEVDKDVEVVSVQILKKKRGRSKEQLPKKTSESNVPSSSKPKEIIEIINLEESSSKKAKDPKASISSESNIPSSSKPKEIIETINLEESSSKKAKDQKVSAKKTNLTGKGKKVEPPKAESSDVVAVKSSTSTSEGPKDFKFLKPTTSKAAAKKVNPVVPPKETKSEGSEDSNADQKNETVRIEKPKMTCTVATQTLEEEALESSEVKNSENKALEQTSKTSRAEESKMSGKKILVSSVEIINVDARVQKVSTSSGPKNLEPKQGKVSESVEAERRDDDETIKIEDDGNNEAAPSAIIVEDQDSTQGVKYETVEQIHTEFKYESQSETEEMLKKRRGKQGGPMRGKRRGLNKTEDMKGQTTIDSFFKIVDLNGKIQTYNRNPVFKCDHCLYVGNSKANLERHSLIHQNPDEISWFNCTDCPYRSKYKHQLKSHSLIHMKPEEIDFFQCPHCEVKCSRKHNLRNHIKSIHADRDYTFSCAECSYATFSKDRLVAHLKKHSKEVHTCNLCKFVTKRRDYLESHIKMKHTQEVERPFPCDTCSYKGKTKRELDKHFDRMHNKDQLHAYQCNHCSFNSIYKKNLEFHLLHMHQNSEGFQKFICGHCNKTFVYKNGLKVHIIRCHIKLGDEDWHKCLECKYKSKDVTTLKRHIKRNHGAPRLHCKQCSFATNRQMSMDAHLKTHEYDNEDILKCPECPYRIIQMSSFLYHMKVIHGKPITAKDAEQFYMQDD